MKCVYDYLKQRPTLRDKVRIAYAEQLLRFQLLNPSHVGFYLV